MLLSLGLHLVTAETVDAIRLSDIARECFGNVFRITFVTLTRSVMELGALAATNWFPSVLAFCEYTETNQDVLENLFLDIVTCSRNNKSSFALCVTESCAFVALLALCSRPRLGAFSLA